MSSLMSKDEDNSILLGYYGKSPQYDDFIGKGLPRSFREPWDAWVQDVINTCHHQMGEKWIQHYLACPLYCFALSGGICGEQAWLGVIIPSMDQVGRYYPMTVCRSLPASDNLLEAMPKHTDWFEWAGQLAISCLDERFSLKRLEQQLQAMEQELNKPQVIVEDDEPTLVQHSIQKYPSAAWRTSLADPAGIKMVFPSLLDVLLQDFCFAYSLWWTRGAENTVPSLVLAKALPPVDGAGAMFDGQWQKWGWANQHVAPISLSAQGGLA